jgi:hypothetical protein
MLKLKALMLVVPLTLTLPCARADSQGGAAAKPAGDIRRVDFRNFTYTRPCDGGAEAVRLRDGRGVGPDDAWAGLMRVAYGDLTGDGAEEAVVLLRGQNTRISRTLDEVFVFTMKDGKPVALDSFEAGRRGDYVLSVQSLGSNFKVESGLLVLDQAVRRTGEYVPTQYYTVKLRWNGVQMAEVERTCLKPLPEGMREVG